MHRTLPSRLTEDQVVLRGLLPKFVKNVEAKLKDLTALEGHLETSGTAARVDLADDVGEIKDEIKKLVDEFEKKLKLAYHG